MHTLNWHTLNPRPNPLPPTGYPTPTRVSTRPHRLESLNLYEQIPQPEAHLQAVSLAPCLESTALKQKAHMYSSDLADTGLHLPLAGRLNAVHDRSLPVCAYQPCAYQLYAYQLCMTSLDRGRNRAI